MGRSFKNGIGGAKRKVKTVAWGHTAIKWERWSLNPVVRL